MMHFSIFQSFSIICIFFIFHFFRLFVQHFKTSRNTSKPPNRSFLYLSILTRVSNQHCSGAFQLVSRYLSSRCHFKTSKDTCSFKSPFNNSPQKHSAKTSLACFSIPQDIFRLTPLSKAPKMHVVSSYISISHKNTSPACVSILQDIFRIIPHLKSSHDTCSFTLRFNFSTKAPNEERPGVFLCTSSYLAAHSRCC